jgi:hypothetical protein
MKVQDQMKEEDSIGCRQRRTFGVLILLENLWQTDRELVIRWRSHDRDIIHGQAVLLGYFGSIYATQVSD